MSTRPPRAARFPAALDPTNAAPTPAPEVLRPQRLLRDAAREAARQVRPAGLGLDSDAVRARMVERLHAGGIADPRVLQAFGAVARHRFVDPALANQAYEDTSLPIGLGQTISKPSVVARMLSLLFQSDGARQRGSLGRALEIGTGCGYQTALLCHISASVVSIERLKGLHDKARAHLAGLRQAPVRLLHGDGRLGHAPGAPYDSIVAAAGGQELPAAWIEQLAPGGRLVAPMHDARAGGQVLLVLDRRADGLHRQVLDAVHFVPLKSGIA